MMLLLRAQIIGYLPRTKIMLELSLKSLLKKRSFFEFEQFQKLALLKNQEVILAGGVFRKFINPEDKIVDFDLFFKTKDALEETKERLVRQGAETIFMCPNGQLFTYVINNLKIQCININLVKDATELLDSFDINASRFALVGNTIVTYNKAIEDVKNKLITFHKITYPLATFKRVIKYQNKGYYIPTEEIDFYCDYIWRLGREGLPYSETVYLD